LFGRLTRRISGKFERILSDTGWILGSSEVCFAVAALGLWKAFHQLHGKRPTARRASGRPITAAIRAFLEHSMRAIKRFTVDTAVENEVTFGVITD
jgi:hypothetical protein